MDGAQVPAPEEGYMVFCFSSPWAPESSPWSGTVLARPCPLPLHTLTSHPGSVFPAKSPERTWPKASLSEAARQVLQISGLSEKVAQVSPAPEGHPWLAGSSPPAPPPPVFFPHPARQAGDSRSLPTTCLRQPLGIRAMLGDSRSAHLSPAWAPPPQTGRLYLLRHHWKAGTNRPVEKILPAVI